MKKPVVIKIRGLPLRVCILLFPVVVIFCLYVLRKSDYDSYLKVVHEDSLVEYLTSAFFLISAIIAARISISFFKQKRIFFGLSYVFLACVMFLVFGEEISWGQRLLDVASPQFFMEHSRQKEINLHNLRGVGRMLAWAFVLIGLYGAGAWMCFLIVKKHNILINHYFIPNWYLATYFIPILLFTLYWFKVYPYNNFLGITWREGEPAELILSMGFFLFVLINRFRQIQEFNLPESKFLTVTST